MRAKPLRIAPYRFEYNQHRLTQPPPQTRRCHHEKRATDAKSLSSTRQRYLDNLSVFVATPDPQAIALRITMPDDLVNYNIGAV